MAIPAPALALARTPRPQFPAPDSPGPCPCHSPSLDLFDLREREEGRAGRGRREGARAGRGPWPRRERRAPALPPRLEQSQRDEGVGSPGATFLQAAGRRGIVLRSRHGPSGDSWLSELCALSRPLTSRPGREQRGERDPGFLAGARRGRKDRRTCLPRVRRTLALSPETRASVRTFCAQRSSVLLPARLYRKIRKSALKILILHAGHVW